MNLAITYYKDHLDDPMKMLQSVSGKLDTNYTNFLDIMSISYPNNIDNIFDDYYGQAQIKWFNAAEMDDDSIRQHIGNVNFVIIYDNGKGPLEIEKLTVFGKMVQFFLIVKKAKESQISVNHGPKYRLGFVRKTLNPVSPMIPVNHLFDEHTLRDFILTKAYNCYVQMKYDSELSVFHSRPATVELNTIAQKYTN